MATYSTKQQKAVLSCIEAQGDRTVTANELVDALHRSGENIGIATVYRQLERLEAQGMVHKVTTEEGAYYQYCPGSAANDCFLLKCEKCGRIAHVDCERLSPLYAHLESEHHFAINPRKTMLYGLCANCREDI